jgi:hypothetical protein
MKGRPGGFALLPKNWPQNNRKNMANEYLVEIHKLIDQRLEDANSSIGELVDDPLATKFQEGRIRALSDFKDYLTKKS